MTIRRKVIPLYATARFLDATLEPDRLSPRPTCRDVNLPIGRDAMTVLRDMFANELPTAIYFCATAVMLAVYGGCALSLLRPAHALATRRRTIARA
jgi:hypothetical protein